MPATKLTTFLGVAPKTSEELLPNTVAQAAVNAKLSSGDLIPYRAPKEITNVQRSGNIKTIYPLTEPITGNKKWLSWLTDVDIAVTTSLNEEEQRLYYTGDGAPKVTNYDLAIQGAGPYPVGYYDLGLPLPETVPTTTSATFTAKTSSTITRDTGNIVTMVTSAAHGLKSGNVVSVTGFTYRSGTYGRSGTTITVTLNGHGLATGASVVLDFTSGGATDGTYTITVVDANTFTCIDSVSGTIATSSTVNLDMRSFNATNIPVTVVDSTTFTYFAAGFAKTTFSTSQGSVTLAGNTLRRTYVYTWVTPWGEESIPSEPTTAVYVKEGQQVTVTGLPTAKPAGNNFICGFRLYRSVTGTTGSSYLRLKTVWFQLSITQASRTSNVVTAKTTTPHNLLEGDLIKITGMAFGGVPDTSFNITDGVVTSAPDDFTFTYVKAGSDKALTATTAGTLFWDIAEVDSNASRYYEGNTFIDDYNVSGLSIGLDTLDADPPDENMKGICTAQNNILVGFVGNELCFSDPARPWSWPIKYRLVFEDEIVAISPVSGSILVMTTKYPHIVSGSTPANMSSSRIDTPMPCVSKRGVVNAGYGVVFPTYGGLGSFGPSGGAEIVTRLIHDWDTWARDIDSTTIVAGFYNGTYFGSHSAGSFIFERNEQIGGFFVTTPIKFIACYYDASVNKFYYIADTNGNLNEWDAPGQPFLNMEWRSKVFVTQEYVNVGAARVVADYESGNDAIASILEYNASLGTFNSTIWAVLAQLGTVNGPLDYTDPETSTFTEVLGALNSFMVNHDPVTRYPLSIDGAFAVGFRLWANKQLIADVSVTDSSIFRLPTGYKSDTFEVAVSGAIRIRAIHFGETPYGLRAV